MNRLPITLSLLVCSVFVVQGTAASGQIVVEDTQLSLFFDTVVPPDLSFDPQSFCRDATVGCSLSSLGFFRDFPGSTETENTFINLAISPDPSSGTPIIPDGVPEALLDLFSPEELAEQFPDLFPLQSSPGRVFIDGSGSSIGIFTTSVFDVSFGEDFPQEASFSSVSHEIGEEFYLGFINTPFDGNPDFDSAIGWGKFVVDENLQLTLLDNAVAYNSQGIVVGTSALVIPEPSFALPLILGAAVVLLRRRKNVQVCH